jgi:magnesium-protoporphyrin O-methyltransferase
VVTLDRVVCCYPQFAPLLELSLDHAERCIALSYPREVWFVRVGNAFENGLRRLKKNPFRTFIHPVSRKRNLIAQRGFDLAGRDETWEWCVDLYIRRSA